MLLSNVFGSGIKVKVLRSLANLNTPFSVEELSSLTGMSVSGINESLQELRKEGIVVQVKTSGTKLRLYKLSDVDVAKKLYELFYLEKVHVLRHTPLHVWNRLETAVMKVKENFSEIFGIVLSGSMARGDMVVSSDVDVLIILERPDEVRVSDKNRSVEIRKIFNEVFATSKNKSNVKIITYDKWQMDKQANSDLYNKIQQEGVILSGQKSIP